MAKVVTQNRFKSVVLWTTLAGAVISFLVGSGIIDLALSQTIKEIILAVTGLLVAFGILNNPTDPKGL
jgi:uncharacterized membrane protein